MQATAFDFAAIFDFVGMGTHSGASPKGPQAFLVGGVSRFSEFPVAILEVSDQQSLTTFGLEGMDFHHDCLQHHARPSELRHI